MHIQRIQSYNHQTAFKQIYQPFYLDKAREFDLKTQEAGHVLKNFHIQANLVSHIYESPRQNKLEPGHLRTIVVLTNGQAFELEAKRDSVAAVAKELNEAIDSNCYHTVNANCTLMPTR